MLCKVLYIADLFCLHANIRPGNIAISLFFGALKLLTKLKMSHPKGSLLIRFSQFILLFLHVGQIFEA